MAGQQNMTALMKRYLRNLTHKLSISFGLAHVPTTYVYKYVFLMCIPEISTIKC